MRTTKSEGRSLRYRALWVLLFGGGVYTFSFLLGAGLVLLGIIGVLRGILWALPIAGWGAFILISTMPRSVEAELPGHEVRREDEPRLFALLESVAQAYDQSLPDWIYVTPRLNAWAGELTVGLGRRPRRILSLGLPLLAILEPEELRSVLAHEFGHSAGEDAGAMGMVYSMRESMLRTVDRLERTWGGGALQLPFIVVSRLFLRASMGVARDQEIRADALAAERYGAASLVRALCKIQVYAPLYQLYLQQDLAPVLKDGYSVALVQGFVEFLKAPKVAREVGHREYLLREEAVIRDPYDTHPPLSERAARLGEATPERVALPEAGLAAFLDHPEEIDLAVVRNLLKHERREERGRITWTDVGEQVHIPAWHRALRRLRVRLDGLTPASLVDLNRGAEPIILNLGPLGLPPGMSRARRERGLFLLGCALAVRLYKEGWRISALPGREYAMERDGQVIEPFVWTAGLAGKVRSADEWLGLCARSGIAEIALNQAAE